MKTVIEIEKLGYSYGEGWILNDLSLKIEQGDFVAVIGPNGAGKSTLLRLLAGILKPAQGRIAIFGQDRENFTAWDKIGYVPQNPARQHRAFPISVREVVSLGRLSGGSMFQHYTHEDKAAVDDIIERFSLKELAHRKIGELSGGQQQRVAIARALVNNPKVLLLDEPLGALDYQLRKNLQLELKNLQRGLGLTFIYVTHDQEEALTMSDRIVVMNKGVIEQDDNPDTIYHYPNTRFVAKFIGESNFFETESETLVIRPEKLNLCPEYEDEQAEKQHPEPGYYGTVVDVVFYGTIDKVFIRLDNSNQTVVAYQYFDDVKRWSPDERVGIWWYKKDEVKVSR